LKARVTADWVDLLQCLLAPHPAARLASAGELKARVLDLKPSIASG
jgi:hypothetical protein